MRERRTSDNIYKLLGCTVVGDITYVGSATEATRLWHMRLGHLGEKGMKELHKRDLLSGVKSCTIGLCKFCIMGKQSRVS